VAVTIRNIPGARKLSFKVQLHASCILHVREIPLLKTWVGWGISRKVLSRSFVRHDLFTIFISLFASRSLSWLEAAVLVRDVCICRLHGCLTISCCGNRRFIRGSIRVIAFSTKARPAGYNRECGSRICDRHMMDIFWYERRSRKIAFPSSAT